jgi:hypothetical protein
MRLAITTFLIVATASMICGCGSLVVKHPEPDRAAIEQKYSSLDLSHGVSRDGALIVAQHYMLSKGYDSHWWIASATKIDDDSTQNTWTVEFAPKEDGSGTSLWHLSDLTIQMMLPYWVTINKDSGQISVVVVQTKKK